MNKIIEFFNSELCFWINFSLGSLGLLILFVFWLFNRRAKKHIYLKDLSPTEYIKFTDEEYEALAKMRRTVQHESIFFSKGELALSEVLGKRLEDKEFHEKANPRRISYTREELLAECKEKYSNLKIENCPICDSNAKLSFSIHSSNDSWGLPAGYAIDCEIRCSKCSCNFDYYTVFNGEYEKIEKKVNDYVSKWNTRFDGCVNQIVSFQRPDSYKEDKPGET